MEKHRGEILEMAVRKSPYPIKALAEKLGISRNTLYNKFREHNLNYDFILKVGDIIHYDFKDDFPELKTTVPIHIAKHARELWKLERRYLQLLERYDKLFSLLVKLTHEHGLDALKQEIDQLTEKTSRD